MPFWNLSPFRRLFARRPHDDAARALYGAAVTQARRPEFYDAMAVADTVDGRFDMVALHVWLILRRLRGGSDDQRALSQALFDIMFADMDQNLRELGVGDLGVGKRVRRMAEAFFGRVAAYDEGLARDDDALAAALRRNLYRKVEPPPDAVAAMAGYVRRADAALAAQDLERLMAGQVAFVAPARDA